MTVKFIGDSNPRYLLNGKEYQVMAVEGDWYRIIDESGDDYLYLQTAFEVVA